jgi:restriction system protein
MAVRYYHEVRHEGLGKHRIITGTDEQIVKAKANAQLADWERLWQDRQAAELKRAQQQKAVAMSEYRTRQAQQLLDELGSLLAHTLTVDDAIEWESLKDLKPFGKPCPSLPAISAEPQPEDEAYRPQHSLLDSVFRGKRKEKEVAARARFEADHARWVAERDALLAEHERLLAEWHQEREAYVAQQVADNRAIEQRRQQYLEKVPAAIVDYCDMVLARSKYPDCLPATFELDLLEDTRTLIVDYQLPAVEALPRVKEVKYVASRKEFKHSTLTDAQVNSLYDSVVYQIALRTVHELFEADRVDALAAVVFNGWVTSTDPGTGHERTVCILSLHTTKEQFCAINLARVDPKQCFRNLKGVGSPRLHSLTAVAPLMEISREDRRFVQPLEVASKLDEGYNLAAMDWGDFEHLVRELFEKEFTQSGGEVKVTQASRDGGVDAIAFDPDPIRGGKIVIQAKRYTNTVGVSAVRDLYGTVVNEGATKGILVTTSDYGPDAHEFAKGKPLTLLSGANLLHLLAKHGYKARIDLAEARRLEKASR